MSKELETTFYRFQSEVRAFLSKLLKKPVDAQPSKYLKDRDFTRKKLINELLSRDVIERHEKILDRTNSDEKEAKYVVKFKVHKKDFEKRLHRIYIKYFEKNEPEKKINEEADIRSCANVVGVVGVGKPGGTADRWAQYIDRNDNGYKPALFANEEEMKEKILNGPDGDTYRKRGGIKEEAGAGAAAGAGAGSGGEAPAAPAADSGTDEKADGGRGQYSTPVLPMQRRTIYAGTQGDIKTKNPILGKTITAESKKSRRIFITEEQWNRILEGEGLAAGGATTTTSVSSEVSDNQLGPVKPGQQFFDPKNKKNDKFMKPAMDREPGFSVERIGEKK